MNKWIMLSAIALVFIGVSVSRLKYEVVFLRKNLKNIQTTNESYIDDIKVLSAEWSFLNSPKRLEKLAKKHLPAMKPLNSKQIIKYDKIIGAELKQNYDNKNDFGSLLDKIISGEEN